MILSGAAAEADAMMSDEATVRDVVGAAADGVKGCNAVGLDDVWRLVIAEVAVLVDVEGAGPKVEVENEGSWCMERFGHVDWDCISRYVVGVAILGGSRAAWLVLRVTAVRYGDEAAVGSAVEIPFEIQLVDDASPTVAEKNLSWRWTAFEVNGSWSGSAPLSPVKMALEVRSCGSKCLCNFDSGSCAAE